MVITNQAGDSGARAGANGRASGKELLMWHEPEIVRGGEEA
jgi:hypothetical protein